MIELNVYNPVQRLPAQVEEDDKEIEANTHEVEPRTGRCRKDRVACKDGTVHAVSRDSHKVEETEVKAHRPGETLLPIRKHLGDRPGAKLLVRVRRGGWSPGGAEPAAEACSAAAMKMGRTFNVLKGSTMAVLQHKLAS